MAPKVLPAIEAILHWLLHSAFSFSILPPFGVRPPAHLKETAVDNTSTQGCSRFKAYNCAARSNAVC
jgi:hypothetical protein